MTRGGPPLFTFFRSFATTNVVMILRARLSAVFAAFVLALAVAAPAAHALPAGFEEVTLASGLEQPTAVTFAPASDGRMFIAEQPGRVKVRMPDGSVSTILDWRDKVNAYGDRGLVGIAADTDFGANGYLYILFVADNDATDDDGAHSSRLVRLTVAPDNSIAATKNLVGGSGDQGACAEPDGNHTTTADASLDCIPAWATTHSIGTIASDPRDGTLWFGSGDAQSVEFTTANRPKRLLTFNEETFVGKVMHIDREGRGLASHPFCPGVTDLDRVCTKIYAKGFRNPFRFTVPTRPGAGVIAGDVGNVSREELDTLKPGGNYGWPCWEGADVRPNYYNGYSLCSGYVSGTSPRNVELPDFAYGHPIVNGSPQGAVMSGPVYEGAGYPGAYQGALFFGDYALGFIRYFPAGATPGTFSITPQTLLSFGDANSSVQFDQRAAFTQLTSAPNGDVVVVDFLTGADYSGPGRVVKYTYTASNRAPLASATIAQEELAPGAVAELDASGSTDPDSDPLTFAWDFDGNGSVDSTDVSPSWTTPTTPGVYTPKVTVTDPLGRSATATVQVLVGVHRPRVTITSPAADSLYDGGQAITFSGDATDPDDSGTFPAAQLRWEIRLIHGSHFHPLVDMAGMKSGQFTALQDHGLDSYYRIRLVATDATGLEGSKTITVKPRPATLSVASEPAGAPISVGEDAVTAPRSISSAVGLNAVLRAAETFSRDGRTYRFTRWSDGVTARERDYVVPAGGGTLTAIYAPDPLQSGGSGAGGGGGGGTSSGGGGTTGGAGGTTTPPKVTPKLTLTPPWTAKRRVTRTITGVLTGVSATPKIQVALARTSGTRCRWWATKTKGFRRAGSCASPAWTTAKVRRTSAGWAYTASLKAAVSRRAGRIQARAIVGGKTVAKVTVRVSGSR